jgi:MFS family permease
MSTIADPPAKGAVAAVPRKAYLGTLLAACSAAFVAQANSAIPATMNGLFQVDLGATGNQITWITAGFMIAVVVFEFTFGVLGDMFGRKRLVMIGTAVLLIGNSVCATAGSPHPLIIGSALTGLGSGAMLPGSLALVASLTQNSAARAKAVAVWAGFLSAGAGAVPVFGGAFAHYGNWRGAFWVLAALAALSILAMAFFASESAAPEGRKLDVPGQLAFAVGLILVLFAAVQGPEEGWGEPRIVACFIIGALVLALFIVVEARSASPILHLDLFRNRAFALTSLASVIGMFAFLGTGYTLSMWMGPTQHQDPLRIAVVFVLLQAPTFVLIPVMSRLLETGRATGMLISGFVLIAAGAFLLTRLEATNSSLTPFLLPALLVGVGFSLSLNSVIAVALDSVPEHLAGMASATVTMFRDLGFSLGPVFIGAIALSKAGNELTSALHGSNLPAADLEAASKVAEMGGTVAVNGIMPGQPGAAAHGLAMASLDTGLTSGFVVCGIASVVAAVVIALGMGLRRTARAS